MWESLAVILAAFINAVLGPAVLKVLSRRQKTICRSYQTHIEDRGWEAWTTDGDVSGTTGQSRRIEAIRIKLADGAPLRMGITYQVHVAGIGWMDWVADGEMAGTTGQSRRMEAIRIRLSNAPAGMTVIYQVHVAGFGWLDWVASGEVAGTIGQHRQLEAIRIQILGG